MSKNVNKTIQTTINEIRKATVSAFGARYYEADQVIAILNNLMKDIGEDDDEDQNGPVITQSLIDTLVESIEEQIENNIDNLSDSDIVDEDSIEITLSSGRYSIDNIDCDKENIKDEAKGNIEDCIKTWAYENKIVTA
jgi:hypothetical protein